MEPQQRLTQGPPPFASAPAAGSCATGLPRLTTEPAHNHQTLGAGPPCFNMGLWGGGVTAAKRGGGQYGPSENETKNNNNNNNNRIATNNNNNRDNNHKHPQRNTC